MAFSQVLVFFALISATIQQHVYKLRYNPKFDVPTSLTKNLDQRVDDIDLSFYVKPDGTVSISRQGLEDGEDRICKKTGRCGCGRGRCGRQGDNDEDKDSNALRQILNHVEKELVKDTLRCPGGFNCRNELGKNRQSYRTLNNDHGNEALRCKFGRCGRKPRYENADGLHKELRCKYGRCGRQASRSDDSDGNLHDEQLRCKYGRCGRGRSREGDSKTQLSELEETLAENYNLNVVVVDLSNHDNLLEELEKLSTNKLLDEDNREVFSKVKDSDEIHVAIQDDYNDGEVVDRVVKALLSTANNDENINDEPIRPNELVNFYLEKKKLLIGNALNFVKNNRGSKNLDNLTREQIRDLQVLRAQVQRFGANSDDAKIEAAVLDVIIGDGAKSIVLSHGENNNNVYIPKWVMEAVIESRKDSRKKLFPLTARQKIKITSESSRNDFVEGKKRRFWRRNTADMINKYGVPFQLQVQGLGQVNT